MKPKPNYIIILLFTIINSQVSCQKNSTISDLHFLNYSNYPKKIIETRTFPISINVIGKDEKINKSVSVFYFTKDGFLTKVEYYSLKGNEFLNELDENDIDEIYKYNSNNNSKRYFKNITGGSGMISAEGYLEKISDSLYIRVSESKIFNTSNEKSFYFDKTNRLKKTEHTGFLYSNTEIKRVEHYTYADNLLVEINSEDFITQTKSKTIYKNQKLDQRGNLIYEELYDENDTLKQKVERVFDYY
jgi:hypothetical protein